MEKIDTAAPYAGVSGFFLSVKFATSLASLTGRKEKGQVYYLKLITK